MKPNTVEQDPRAERLAELATLEQQTVSPAERATLEASGCDGFFAARLRRRL